MNPKNSSTKYQKGVEDERIPVTVANLEDQIMVNEAPGTSLLDNEPIIQPPKKRSLKIDRSKHSNSPQTKNERVKAISSLVYGPYDLLTPRIGQDATLSPHQLRQAAINDGKA
jgi:hypothetical protein